MKPVWIVLLCLLGAAVLAALVWLLVWYIEQRVLAKSLGRASEGADAQAAWEQHILRKQDWTADSEPGRAALARVRAAAHTGPASSHDREEQNAAEQHLPLRIDRSVLRRRRARIFTGRAQRYALCGFAASRTAIWTAAAQAGILAPAAPAGDLGNDAHEKPPICKDLIRICFPYHTLFGFFRQEGEPAAPPSCAAHQNCICTPPDTSDVWMRSCCPVRALTAMTQRCPSSVSHRYS